MFECSEHLSENRGVPGSSPGLAIGIPHGDWMLSFAVRIPALAGTSCRNRVVFRPSDDAKFRMGLGSCDSNSRTQVASCPSASACPKGRLRAATRAEHAFRPPCCERGWRSGCRAVVGHAKVRGREVARSRPRRRWRDGRARRRRREGPRHGPRPPAVGLLGNSGDVERRNGGRALPAARPAGPDRERQTVARHRFAGRSCATHCGRARRHRGRVRAGVPGRHRGAQPGAAACLGSMQPAGSGAIEEIRDAEVLLARGVRRVTKLVLFPVRFMFTAATGPGRDQRARGRVVPRPG
jgi:hypothetical protein